ncbi:MAG TPA: TIGR00282 family metallophosphoesterase [Spirochaetia bacterium]|nr:TIGR00282 family metallophosphoesterase [Spirochaetia bacterium]
MASIRILFIGEIVGKSGVWVVKELLPKIRKERSIDFVIADGEGATGGFGIGKSHAVYLHKLGVDSITTGECCYYKKDIVDHFARAPYLLRPANYPPKNPGRGFMIYQQNGHKIAVISLLGVAGFKRVHLKNPYTLLPKLLDLIVPETKSIVLDFHAVTTAEKATMFAVADGRLSAVIGTHTKAITSDERVLPGGTAVITDAGRTGSLDSVAGLDPDIEIRKLTTLIHEYSREAWTTLELQGVVLEIGDDGKAAKIERIRESCKAPPQASRDAEVVQSEGNLES